jgi:hypothetical protein
MKSINLAKQKYRAKKGITRMKIEPLQLQGTTVSSVNLFRYKNKILQLVVWFDGDCEFITVR